MHIFLTKKHISTFQYNILSWYQKNKRDLPWRRDRDPYHILVSEVMLQQTQAQRVIPKYKAWLEAFPTITSLAHASTRDVLLQWSGLGYNRRALYLHKFAKEIIEKFAGVIPQNEKVLRTLPGIGEYTVRALLCFAFDKQVAVVDTNVRKVILVKFISEREEALTDSGKKVSKKEIDEIAQLLLPQGKAYDWNQALMDYASQELKAQKSTIPKQSKFHDSDRYYRGQILKELLKNTTYSKKDLQNLFADIQTMTTKRFEKILSSLVKDGLVSEDIESRSVYLEE